VQSRGRAVDQRTEPASDSRGRDDHHGQIGHRKDHAAAQPGPAVALHDRHHALARRPQRDDVPLPTALRSARRSPKWPRSRRSTASRSSP
jgi:hypothetical protein